jgi:hypothetical protein
MFYGQRSRIEKSISPKPDYWIYRMIVSVLSLTVLMCISGTIWLQIQGLSTPDLLTGMGMGALGALSGLLVPSPPRP